MDERQKVYEILGDFDTAMLVTRGDGGDLEARPMQVAGLDPGGDVWFMTGRGTRKMDEIARDGRVLIVCQDERRRSLSLTGVARPVVDRAKVRELWSEPYRTWFPDGPDDADLVLLAVRPESAEYWDNAGVRGVKYLAEAARAYLTGQRPRVEEGDQHGRVDIG